MNEHHDHERWLAYLEGELSVAEQADLQRELADDPALAARLAQMQAQRAMLRELKPVAVTGDPLAAALAQTAGQAQRPWWRPLAAAACLLAAVGLFWLGLMDQDTQPLTIDRIAYQDSVDADAMAVMTMPEVMSDDMPMMMPMEAMEETATAARPSAAGQVRNEVIAEKIWQELAPVREPQLAARGVREASAPASAQPMRAQPMTEDPATTASPEPRPFYLTAAQVRQLLAWLNDPQATMADDQAEPPTDTETTRYEVRVQLRPLPAPGH